MTKNASGLEKLVAEAIRADARELDIEYKDGYDEVCAMHGPIGFGIARVRSSSAEGIALREELFGVAKKGRSLSIAGHAWDVRCRIRDSFGEAAFRVKIRDAGPPAPVNSEPAKGTRRRSRRLRSGRARR